MGKEDKKIKCAKCDSLIGEDSRFCSKCGSFIEEKADTLTYTPPLEKIIDNRLHFLPGDQFGSRYKIVEEIGRGGMGYVYKAIDIELDLTVALKMIRPEYSANPRFIQRFKEEIRHARSILHKNVIRIHDLGEIDDIKFISMDYIKGHDLKELITSSGCLSVETAINITRQICEGLQVAHQKNIAHLDLKPRNIMIDNDGKVYIMDFGVAKSMITQDTSPEKKFIGTPPYISPEQAKGEDVDQRSDIYSLGIIIFEMLTGKRPFEAETIEGYVEKHIHQKPSSPRHANPLIPPFLEHVILRCLEKDKTKRYQSANEILQDLEEHKEESKAYTPTSRIKNVRGLFYLVPFVMIVGITIYLLLLGKKQPEIVSVVEGGRIPLVVMPFENNTGDESLDYQRRALSNGIIQDLLQSKYIRVITGDTLYGILDRLNILEKKSYSSEDLKNVVIKARAEHILYGNFRKGESTCRINAILKNAITDKIVDSKTIQGEGDKFFLYAPDQLTPWIRTEFNLGPQELAADSVSDKDIEEILTGSPEAWKLYTLANQYFLQRKYQESNDLLKKAVEIDDEFALAYRQMSINYDYLSEIDQTKIYAQKALSLSNKVSLRDRYLVRGWAYMKLEDSYKKAIEIYKEMLEIYPGDEDGNAALGSIYRIIEDWDKALERYKIVFELNPSYSSWNIVRFYTAMGLYSKAEEFLDTNQHNYGNQVYYHMDLGLIHLCQRKYDLALIEIEKAFSLEPDFSMTTELKGNFFHLQNNFKMAEYYYRQLLDMDDSDSQFYGRFWLARLYLGRGEYQKCKKEIVQWITKAGNNSQKTRKLEFLLILAYLNLQVNQPEEANGVSNEALVIASDINSKKNKIFALFFQGYSQLKMNEIDRAKNTAEKLKFLITEAGVPKHIRFYHLLKGLIAESENKPSLAILDIEKAVTFLSHEYRAFDNHALYYYFLSLSYFNNGEMAKAQQQFEKTVNLTTGRLQWGDLYAKSFYWLGRIFQKKGKIEEALDNYEQFLNLWKEADPDIPEIKDAQGQLSLLRKKAKD